MEKILNCYLNAKKKVMALCLRVQFFLANPVCCSVIVGSLFVSSKALK